METMMKTTLLLLSTVAVVYSATTRLTILPAKTHMLVLEGDKLSIDCIQMYDNKDQEEMAVFKKDDQDIASNNINGYHISRSSVQMSMKVETDNSYKATLSLTKNVTTLSDQGVFTCYVQDKSSTITVNIITLTKVDTALPVTGSLEKAELQCELSGVPASHENEKQFEWKHGDSVLKDGDKYSMFNNGTLIIKDASRADMGEYFCTVVFFPNSSVERHTFTPRAVYLKAGPKIEDHDNTKNMVEGDKLELKCEVTGYPLPTVNWYKDSKPMNESNRIHFVQYKDISTGMLQIFELTYDDEGNYMCEASNDVPPLHVNATMKLRVKDKLAALWPFLGIVAEVIVLCVIILIYEKRRSKKLADEDDSADGNADNTVDHKDVRHRRT